MPIRPESTVAEVVSAYAAAPTLFEVVGIDYCCQPSRSLRDAAAGAGMTVTDIMQFVEKGAAPPPPAHSTVSADAPLSDLAKEIRNHYHRRARISLASMIWMARALASAHSEKFPVLWDVKNELEDLAHELIPHMLREERYLFPYITGMDQGRMETETVVPLFGTVEYPLQQLRHDHAHDEEALLVLKDLTKNFVSPDGACARHRDLYAALTQFTSDLLEHIRLENDVLFPRAVAMEKQLAQKARA
jgi:regulator of cell morphogenesis and NO signaling